MFVYDRGCLRMMFLKKHRSWYSPQYVSHCSECVYALLAMCTRIVVLCRVPNISCNPVRAAAPNIEMQEQKKSLLQDIKEVEQSEKQTRSVCWFAHMRLSVVYVCVWSWMSLHGLFEKKTEVHTANSYALIALRVYMFCDVDTHCFAVACPT